MRMSKMIILEAIEELASKRPLVILLIGAPGSGKSTLVKELVHIMNPGEDRPPHVHCIDGQEQDPRALDKRITHSSRAAIMAMMAGQHVIIDRTNMRKKDRKSWLDFAYTTSLMPVGIDMTGVPLMELGTRIAKRANQGGHYVPPSVIEELIRCYEEPTHAEGFGYLFKMEAK